MHAIQSNVLKLLATLLTTMALLVPMNGYAAEESSKRYEENPSATAMTADLLVARPVLLVATVLGAAIFIVSSPFSLLGGNFKEAAETLVVQPGKAFAVRCLGCSFSGRKADFSDDEE